MIAGVALKSFVVWVILAVLALISTAVPVRGSTTILPAAMPVPASGGAAKHTTDRVLIQYRVIPRDNRGTTPQTSPPAIREIRYKLIQPTGDFVTPAKHTG